MSVETVDVTKITICDAQTVFVHYALRWCNSPSASQADASSASEQRNPNGCSSKNSSEREHSNSGREATSEVRKNFFNAAARSQNRFEAELKNELYYEMWEHLVWCSDFEFDEVLETLELESLFELMLHFEDDLKEEKKRSEYIKISLNTSAHDGTDEALNNSDLRIAQLCARTKKCVDYATKIIHESEYSVDKKQKSHQAKCSSQEIHKEKCFNNFELNLTCENNYRDCNVNGILKFNPRQYSDQKKLTNRNATTGKRDRRVEWVDNNKRVSVENWMNSLPNGLQAMNSAYLRPSDDGEFETDYYSRNGRRENVTIGDTSASLRHESRRTLRNGLQVSKNNHQNRNQFADVSVDSILDSVRLLRLQYQQEKDLLPNLRNSSQRNSEAKVKSGHIYETVKNSQVYNRPLPKLAESMFSNRQTSRSSPADKRHSNNTSVTQPNSSHDKYFNSSLVTPFSLTYDTPKVPSFIYDIPRVSAEGGTPSDTDLIPKVTKMVQQAILQTPEYLEDSLDDSEEEFEPFSESEYLSENDDGACFDDENNFELEKTFFPKDQGGLEVILEESEEECFTSTTSEISSTQQKYSANFIRPGAVSVEESEGIGSAENHSSEESYRHEEDLSSGIHSDGTQPNQRKSDDLDPDDSKAYHLHDGSSPVFPVSDDIPESPEIENCNDCLESSYISYDADQKHYNPPSVKFLKNHFETGIRSHQSVEKNDNLMKKLNSNSKSNFNKATYIEKSLKHSSCCDQVPIRNPLSQVNFSMIGKDFDEVNNSENVVIQKTIEKKTNEKRFTTLNWDPTTLLNDLYLIQDVNHSTQVSSHFINKEGYLEKLPYGKKKTTFWNCWKRRYFKAKDGYLYYYQSEKACLVLQLMGGKIETLDSSSFKDEDKDKSIANAYMLGIDDGKGHYIVVKCSTKKEFYSWHEALITQTEEAFDSAYVQPFMLSPQPCMMRDVVIIDLGSCSIRAGILLCQPTLPTIFFPNVLGQNAEGIIVGSRIFMPEMRHKYTLLQPFMTTPKVEKHPLSKNSIIEIMRKIFAELNIDPKNYYVQVSMSKNVSLSFQHDLAAALMDDFDVKGFNFMPQTLLTLYSYNARSGIIVSVGERIDIVPIVDGYVIENGMSSIPCGGSTLVNQLRPFLINQKTALDTQVESLLIRYVLENYCYCSQSFDNEMKHYEAEPEIFCQHLPINKIIDSSDLTSCSDLVIDFGRFQCTEGLFKPEAWGYDHKGIHQLIYKALMECSLDVRKLMAKSIFLSGGVTLLPGFPQRLFTEIEKLIPPTLTPKVHASPYRYHSSYIGACVLAESDIFKQTRITRDKWFKFGLNCVHKWQC